MLDARTISTSLTLALLGCAGTPPQTTPPTDGAGTATKPEGTGAVGSAEALPGGRPAPLPPKDAPIASPGESVRTGSMACCGKGSCGACTPLPDERPAPLPPMDGKVVPPKESTRKGAAACCGEGTCGPCKPLPAARTAPAPGKMPAAGSVRKGKEECCGEGTCGPC
jgi:hypothetical protein